MAYCNADGMIVHAADMESGGDDSHWERHGSAGTREIVCIDCKQAGREVALQFPQYRDRAPFFRHPPGTAPGSRGHGETAEHIRGKLLIASWASEQENVLPWTVDEELWEPSARLRSDVRARLLSGRAVAFEVQRKELAEGEWDRRHGSYHRTCISDVWFWPPDTPGIQLDLPGTSVVIDVEEELLGVLVADYAGQYLHPTSGSYMTAPTHYAAAPMSEWTVSEHGALVPPPELDVHVGTRPTLDRLARLERYRHELLHAEQAPTAAVGRTRPPSPAAPSGAQYAEDDPSEPQGWFGPPSIAAIRLKQIPISELDERWLRYALRKAGERAEEVEIALYGAAVVAPDTFRRVARRMGVPDAIELQLWINGLRQCGRLLRSIGTIGGLAACLREQAGVVEAVLSFLGGASEGGWGHFILRGKATEALMRSQRPFSNAEVGAVTYAVWVAGFDKDAQPFRPDEEIAAIALISENLTALRTRRTEVQNSLAAGKSLYEAVAAVLAAAA